MTRPLRILWINRFCLADTSSGAAITSRDMLTQLSLRGAQIAVLGMTCYDKPIGQNSIQDQIDAQAGANMYKIKDGRLTHNLIPTKSTLEHDITLAELDALLVLYLQVLEDFKPDMVWFYGGRSFDMMIAAEAKRRGVRTAAYVPNGSYKGTRWCQDVDMIVTETNATSQMYQEKAGFYAKPLGVFIDAAQYVPDTHSREAVTFVNPVLEKGGALVAQLAMALEDKRPDIPFHIVESRGKWADTMNNVCKALGQEPRVLKNVKVISHTSDMRPVYAKSRVHLIPSLWWENAGRVTVEALMNGIPTIVTNRGGPPELTGDAGYKLDLDESYYQSPYNKLLSDDAVDHICALIERIFDDEDHYQDLSARAYRVAAEQHDLRRNGDKLYALFHDFCFPSDQTV